MAEQQQPVRERGQVVPPDQTRAAPPRPATRHTPYDPTTMVPQGRKVDDGQSVRVTLPAGENLWTGDFAAYDGFYGFMVSGVPNNIFDETVDRPIVLQTDGATYETSQVAAADAFDTVGAPVYWDAAGKVLTSAAGGVGPVGLVVRPKDAEGNIWMRLLPQGNTPPPVGP